MNNHERAIMTQDKERELFEEWAKDGHYIFLTRDNGSYNDDQTAEAYHLWQAARSPLFADLAAAVEALEEIHEHHDNPNDVSRISRTILSRLSHYRKGV